MILNVTCPHCGALLDVAPAWLGQPLECGGCGSVFACPELAEEAPPEGAPLLAREKSSRRRRERDDYDRWDGYEEYNQHDDPDSPEARKRGPGYATASLVLGILSLTVGTFFTMGCCGFVQTIISVVGMLLGYIGLRSDARPNAIAGMVMNVLGAVISVVFMSFVGLLFSLKPFGPPPPPPPPATVGATTTWTPPSPPAVAPKGKKGKF